MDEFSVLNGFIKKKKKTFGYKLSTVRTEASLNLTTKIKHY